MPFGQALLTRSFVRFSKRRSSIGTGKTYLTTAKIFACSKAVQRTHHPLSHFDS